MKTKIFTLLLALAASVGTMFASVALVDGMWYNINSDDLTAEVTYRGSSYDLYTNEYSDIVVIPPTIYFNGDTYNVTSIGKNAFRGCYSMNSVTIPNSVTSIGFYAFDGCSGLTSVTIPNTVTSIAEGTFRGCSGLTSVTIPGSITSIGSSAFYNCSGLTSITIPNSITSIGSSAFYNCSGLTSITIPNSVTSIRFYAFYGCSGLTSVTIPGSVTSIENSAFCGCSGLTSVTIPNSVTSIGDLAFAYCSGLTSVTIPNSVTSIGENAFAYCSGLTSVTIPNSVTSIGDQAFLYCSGLTSPVYNAHVFAYMPTSYSGAYTIPDGIESIAGHAFWGCTGLTSVTIPNSVTSIGVSAFRGCTGLISVTIEAETPPTLGSSAFDNTNNCPIYVSCGTLEAYKTAWSDYADRIRSDVEYTITGKVNDANAGSVDYPTSSCGDVVITAVPNNGYHFTQWSDGNTDNPRTFVLTQDTTFTAEFAIDKSGTCGDDNALTWTYDVETKTLTITGKGTLNSNYTFGAEAPTQMQKLVIGNEITSIGDRAFYGMSTINHLIIGGSVATIGNYAFAECRNFDDITCLANVVPVINETTFANVGNKQYIYLLVPAERERAYHRDTYWGEFDIQVQQAEETTVTTNDVQVEPQDNAATFTWPTSNNVASYTIEISKDGVLFCTLTFNANGQLTGIAFAPSRDGHAHAPAAVMTANGLQFTVTGLNSGTQYGYNLTAKDANDQTVATYSGSFTTTSEGEATGIEEISSSLQGGDRGRLILHNGQIFILRGEKVYTVTGQEVK